MHQLFLLSCVLILTVLSTEIFAVPFFIPAGQQHIIFLKPARLNYCSTNIPC